MAKRNTDENSDILSAEITAQEDPARALSESFDALITAFGIDAVREAALEKLGDY